MSRRKTNRRNQHSAGKPAWGWFALGNIVGGFAVFLLFQYGIAGAGKGVGDNQPQAAKPAAEAPSQPRFDFYTLLKENEVSVPPPKVARSARHQGEQGSAQREAGASPQQVYILQAASFREAAEAERLRARLTLANLDVKVESASDSRGTWHRVLVGPFSNRSRMAKARQVLAEHSLMPLVLKRPAH
ncbi:SPOR domain-containing protein [Microbulbifer sp. 2205BS26-8]|uniref:SPOR domain-containing protein n=1 Tax=Microbulbifer sp. 2205BS26-8 TaxID=3064386 RepID=UPI00273EB6FA|nr:SPOR domain-containing protein [Microbulbifer sp. 2205BS26-8]MDP5210125.1 SPOR domain-containing protein [Microbulbifer sp. 2205BS26-8]